MQLMDQNDHAPQFEHTQYHVELQETVLVNSPVLMLRATDADWGKNAELRYSIAGATSLNYSTVNVLLLLHLIV